MTNSKVTGVYLGHITDILEDTIQSTSLCIWISVWDPYNFVILMEINGSLCLLPMFVIANLNREEQVINLTEVFNVYNCILRDWEWGVPTSSLTLDLSQS